MLERRAAALNLRISGEAQAGQQEEDRAKHSCRSIPVIDKSEQETGALRLLHLRLKLRVQHPVVVGRIELRAVPAPGFPLDLKWSPSAGQESGSAKRDSSPIGYPRPVPGALNLY